MGVVIHKNNQNATYSSLCHLHVIIPVKNVSHAVVAHIQFLAQAQVPGEGRRENTGLLNLIYLKREIEIFK